MSRLPKVMVSPFLDRKPEWRVADVPDEPVSDVRERINPEEFRTAFTKQRNLDRKSLHGRPRMPGERKEAVQGFTSIAI